MTRRVGYVGRRELLQTAAGLSAATAGCFTAALTEAPEAPDEDLLTGDDTMSTTQDSELIAVLEADAGPLEDIEIDEPLPVLLAVESNPDKGVYLIKDG